MHSGLHTLAHRAPGSARSRVRWQPYAQLQASVSSASISSRSPPTNYLNTPSTVSSASPYSTPATSYCDRQKLIQTSTTSTATKDPQSKKNALGLVDQAVKTISDIWRNEEIPTVFQTADKATLAQLTLKAPASISTTDLIQKSRNKNTQLPSPISPKTQPSPPEADATPASQIEIEPTCMFGSKTNLVPIKGFVHEVLRRSRTSGLVLQTALCYLEAIRPQLPRLRSQGVMLEPDIDLMISLATPEEMEENRDSSYSDDGMDTVRVNDAGSATISLESLESMPEGDTLKKPKGPSPPMAPLTPLPSPLLCPRRAFLAALILASKFSQDKCYSNRAWAKLSGLPAREIGRCERALGDALGWRLWVGKSAPAGPPQATRPVTRCRSESDLRAERISSFLVSNEELVPLASVAKSQGVVQLPPTPAMGSSRSGLRRCSTLPADAFSGSQPTVAPENMFADSVDQYMSSPEHMSLATCVAMDSQVFDVLVDRNSIEYPPTEIINPVDNFTSPPTPSLTYSPSSTESSSGDRTIQMTTFDEPLPGVAGSDTWSWSDTSPPHLKELGTMKMYDMDPHGSIFAHQFSVPVHPGSFGIGLGEAKLPPSKSGALISLVPPDMFGRQVFNHE